MAPRVNEEHLQQRRANIMSTATEVFIKNGYEHTTMKHVMDATGVSRGGLYHYFSSKENLFEAILEEDLRNEVAKTESLLKTTGSHWNLLMQLIYGKDAKSDAKMDPLAPSKLEFFVTGRNDERRKTYAKKRYDILLPIFSNVIKAGQESGEFSNCYDNEQIGRSIITFIDGIALGEAILPQGFIQPEKQFNLFADFLKKALGI